MTSSYEQCYCTLYIWFMKPPYAQIGKGGTSCWLSGEVAVSQLNGSQTSCASIELWNFGLFSYFCESRVWRVLMCLMRYTGFHFQFRTYLVETWSYSILCLEHACQNTLLLIEVSISREQPSSMWLWTACQCPRDSASSVTYWDTRRGWDLLTDCSILHNILAGEKQPTFLYSLASELCSGITAVQL